MHFADAVTALALEHGSAKTTFRGHLVEVEVLGGLAQQLLHFKPGAHVALHQAAVQELQKALASRVGQFVLAPTLNCFVSLLAPRKVRLVSFGVLAWRCVVRLPLVL